MNGGCKGKGGRYWASAKASNDIATIATAAKSATSATHSTAETYLANPFEEHELNVCVVKLFFSQRNCWQG